MFSRKHTLDATLGGLIKMADTLDNIVCIGAGLFAGAVNAAFVDCAAIAEGYSVAARVAGDSFIGLVAGGLTSLVLWAYNSPEENPDSIGYSRASGGGGDVVTSQYSATGSMGIDLSSGNSVHFD